MPHVILDPACGKELYIEDAEERSARDEYYFCSTECRNRFDENPALYAYKTSGEKGSAAT